MTKLRESTGAVLWILVLAFGGLWVLQDSGAFDAIGGQQQNIAIVDGEPISYQDYTQALEQEVRAYQQRTGEAPPQSVRDQYADLVYDRLIEDRLRQREMERLGIRVSEGEVRRLFWGPDYDPIMVQFFGDGQGGVDRTRLQTVVDDPAAQQDIIALQDYLRAKRRAEKLDALLTAAVRVTPAEVEAEFLHRNRSAATRFVALRYADVPDSAVTVTERDLRRFYDEHRDEFERERTVTLEYVSLSQAPSAQDSAAVLRDLEGLKPAFAAAEDDSAFVAQNFSQTPYSSDFVSPGGLDAAVASAVYADLTAGRVVGPILVGDAAQLVKITGVQAGEEAVARAHHILFGQRGDAEEARAQQRAEAERVKARIAAGELSFEDAARQYSTDQSNAAQGGDLGWFTRERMVAPFSEAVFSAAVGEVVGPVETEYGYHLIRVDERTNQEVRLATLSQSVGTTSATLRALNDRIEDVQYFTSEGGDFAEEAQRQGLSVQEVTVQGDQQFIPGLGNSRTARSFVARAEEGDLSDVIDTGEAFLVLRAREVLPAGFRPFDEVREELEPRVLLEKKEEVQVARLREALAAGGDLDALAEAVGAQARAGTVSFQNLVVPGLGREPAFVGAALGLDEGGTSGVVAGENAAFVLTVTTQTEADPASMTAEQREQIRTQLLNRKRQQVLNRWIQDLREEAEIEDYRALLL